MKDKNKIDPKTANLQDPDVRNKLFLQYQALMYKIVNQFVGQLPMNFDDIVGAAMEGFTLALNKWVPGTSQNFQQYAAWSMRNAILNSANQEGHTVRFSAYQQKKAKAAGKSTFNTIRLGSFMQGDCDNERTYFKEDRCGELGIEQSDFNLETEDSVFYKFYQWMDENFSQRDCHIFYHTYGVKGYQLMKGTEIAKMFNLSAASISVTNKKIIRAIRQNPNVLSMLSDLLK